MSERLGESQSSAGQSSPGVGCLKVLLILLLGVLTLGFGLGGLCSALLGNQADRGIGFILLLLAVGCIALIGQLVRSLRK